MQLLSQAFSMIIYSLWHQLLYCHKNCRNVFFLLLYRNFPITKLAGKHDQKQKTIFCQSKSNEDGINSGNGHENKWHKSGSYLFSLEVRPEILMHSLLSWSSIFTYWCYQTKSDHNGRVSSMKGFGNHIWQRKSKVFWCKREPNFI